MASWLARAARGLRRKLGRLLHRRRAEAPTVATNAAVPILLYHCIGEYPNQYHRKPDDFQKDIAALYARGYRCVRMRDILGNQLDLAETPKPFGLRFDDNTEDQFRIVTCDLPADEIEPEDIDGCTAVGILERFRKEHPDLGPGGMFFLCKHRFRPDGALFGQPELQGTKLVYLLEHGYELGNHTFGHESLSGLSPQEMRETIRKCDAKLESLIGSQVSEVRCFAYPFADVPDDPEKLAIVAERFDYSFVNRDGPLPYPRAENEKYLIPRVTVTRDFDMAAFLDELES